MGKNQRRLETQNNNIIIHFPSGKIKIVQNKDLVLIVNKLNTNIITTKNIIWEELQEIIKKNNIFFLHNNV